MRFLIVSESLVRGEYSEMISRVDKIEDIDLEHSRNRKIIKPFHWLLSSCALANMSDGMSLAFLPLIATSLTTVPSQVSMLEGFRQFPLLILALPAGLLVDKFNRVWAIIFLNIMRSIALLILFIMFFTENINIFNLSILVFFLGSIEAIHDVAMPTVLPGIEKKENLAKCNGKLSSTETAANYFVGRSLGSMIASLVSNAAAVLVSSLFYLLTSMFMIPLVKEVSTSQVMPHRTSIMRTICDGFSYVYNDKNLRYLAIMGVFGNAAFGAIFATLVLYVTKIILVPTWFFGPIQASFAIGSIFSGFLASRIIDRLGTWKALIFSVSIIPFAFLLTPIFPFWITLVLTSFINGASAVVWNTISMSYRQETTPEHLLGRATAVFRLISWGSMPLGSFLGGPIVENFGYSSPYYFGAALAALNIPYAIILRRNNDISSKIDSKID